MNDERELTPENAGAELFGKGRQPTPEQQPEPAKEQPTANDQDRDQVQRIIAMDEENARRERRSEITEEEALVEDVRRFQAEGRIEAAAIGTAKLKVLRQALALGLGEELHNGTPSIEVSRGPDLRPGPESAAEERPEEFTPPHAGTDR